MATKKSKPNDAGIQERTEIWKQVIITVGVVVVALIGSWQAIAIVRLNNQPPTPAPSATSAPATNTPVPVETTNTLAPPNPVVVIATTGIPTLADTATPKPEKLANIDLSKWYRLTNDSLGKSFAMDHWGDTKNIVMDTTGYSGGQYWRFNVVSPGYYSVTSEFYGPGIFLNLLTASNNSLNLSPLADDPKTDYWKVTSSNANCVRFTSQELGDGWSLDMTTVNDIPSPFMAQTSDSNSQCWHLAQVGPIK